MCLVLVHLGYPRLKGLMFLVQAHLGVNVSGTGSLGLSYIKGVNVSGTGSLGLSYIKGVNVSGTGSLGLSIKRLLLGITVYCRAGNLQ